MTGSCPFGHAVTLTAAQALICSAVHATGRLLRRRASTFGSTFAPSGEQPPTARTTPVAERKTVSRYRVFISAPVVRYEEGTSYGSNRRSHTPWQQQGPRQTTGRGNAPSMRRAA